MSHKLKIQTKAQFFARTIVAEVQNGTLKMGVADFSRTPIIAARPRTSVEFETGITREDAMAALTSLLEVIEAHGLPETSFSIDRKDARKFDRMLRWLAIAKQHYDTLSIRSQQQWRELYGLEFRLFNWSIQAEVGKGTSDPTKR
jgi:hypothetical protein